MAYDGFYSGLSTRGSVNEILNLAEATRQKIEALYEQVKAYSLKAAYSHETVLVGVGYEVDPDTATVFHLTLSADSTAITARMPEDPKLDRQTTLIINQGPGARKITWGPNIIWPGGIAPVLSFEAGKEDVVTLLFMPSKGKIYGFFNGGSFA